MEEGNQRAGGRTGSMEQGNTPSDTKRTPEKESPRMNGLDDALQLGFGFSETNRNMVQPLDHIVYETDGALSEDDAKSNNVHHHLQEKEVRSPKSARSVKSMTSRLSDYASVVKDTVSEVGRKMEKMQAFQCCEQQGIKACLASLSVTFVNNFSKGSIAKALLELLIKRNPIKVWRFSRNDIFRFGLVLGLTALTFNAVMCILKRRGKAQGNQFAWRLSRKQAYVIAAMVSSLALSLGL